ncbi:dTDP-4-dehydrorhamnose reductase [Chromobacterium sphagni]|uniref:dTDP-4-dehydrorhamnose reductase n=1 Tax=Chromobacterium sphagni TaxID=1903179 RepID=A0A1S1WWG7_9NEIS|nr:dTDP-4-dehydrorhamnose reductase [Chromobacterium sphagni]OHX11638.1 dTDP-4-dehydrorhamnose reductase [Chromobacterium sphagni]
MMRMLLTGADGQLGFELRRALAPLGELTACGRAQMDLADEAAILAALDAASPEVIVNPAAYTAVDKAETDRDAAYAVNAVAPGVLARWAAANGALLIHYSTDYVFSGDKAGPYGEEDAVDPQSVYGASKCAGERAVRSGCPHHLILRTSWVFGVHGGNFLKTMLRLAQERDALNVVGDQVGAPTSAALIADVTAQLIRHHHARPDNFEFGTYHLTAQGEASWHSYAQRVIRRAGERGFPLSLTAEAVKAIGSDQYPLPAKRPANSRLDCNKVMRAFSLSLPGWEEGVDSVVDQLYALSQAKGTV